jgi:lysyl endopeptidase
MKTQTIQTATLTLLLMSIVTLTYGQVSQGGTPYSFDQTIKTKDGKPIKPMEKLQKRTMPKVNQSKIESIKQKNIRERRVHQFALGFDVNIDLKNESTIDTLDIGILYRYQIESPGAFSLNVIFSEYEVPRGAKLFIYNTETGHIIGAFTSNNNQTSKILPTIPVKGDKITVEYFEPLYPDFNGKLRIGEVNHDFIGFYRQNIEDDFGSSGDCQIDINCSDGDNWQEQKRSVLRIVKEGKSHCTRALINNTNQDGRPYVLTAHHCMCNQDDIDKMIFIFNYESPTCNGGDGNTNQSIAGGTLRATRGNTDFTLLEMSKKPFSTYSPYFAGWDRNDAQGAGGVGIHHPSGDVKKISTFTMVPVDAHCKDGSGNHGCGSFTRVNEDYYRINFVETPNGHGTTEGGSSGSPLFNNNKRIIGQLFGFDCPGEGPMCANPAQDVSVYGKLSSSWDGDSPNQRLRDWLNPTNDVFTLNGINGCGQGMSVNLNITHTITSGSVEFHQATNTITASNRIEAGATATYEAQTFTLTDGFVAEAGSNFVARAVDFNCVVTCDPIDVVTWTGAVCSGDVLCFSVSNATEYYVKIYTIGGSLIFQSSGSVTGPSVCVGEIPSNIAIGTYIAVVSFNNDCHEVSNAYPFFVISCQKSTDSDFETEDEKEQEQGKFLPSVTDTTRLDFDFTIFPNPNDGSFSVKVPIYSIATPYTLEIINSIGKIMYIVEHLNANQVNINQTGLPKGAYFIRIKSGNRVAIQKVIIQ